MAQVKVLINGQVATVEETTPGLFGKLGYTYVDAQTAPQTTQQPTLQTTAPTQTTSPIQPATTQPTPQTTPQTTSYPTQPTPEATPSTTPTTSTTQGFVKVGPAFFQQSPQGLVAVSDPIL